MHNSLYGNCLVDSYRLEQLGSEGQRFVFSFKHEHEIKIPVSVQEKESVLDEDISIVPVAPTDEEINGALGCLYSVYSRNDQFHQFVFDAVYDKEQLHKGKASYYSADEETVAVALVMAPICSKWDRISFL